MSEGLLDPLFGADAVDAVLCDRGRLQAMLDFEAALSRAQARLGLVPEKAARAIAACCRAELYDVGQLGRATARAGNPAIPLVAALTERVALTDRDAARHVHAGATSQDAMDTGLVLQLAAVLALIETDLARIAAALTDVARAHRHTVLAGRTWLQQAQPTTFGLKAAGWLAAVERSRERLRETRHRACVLQFGGAVGTLAASGDQGWALTAALAEELSLPVPELPWHTQRDRMAEVATSLGLLTGSLGKIARDVSLLMQTEVAEACEPAAPGRGGSSAMPQKRNPVDCAVVLAAAVRVPALVGVMLAAMPQAHERGLGDWHAEWETLPEICRLAAGAAERMAQVLEGLEVDPQRMRRNLEADGGLLYAGAAAAALAPRLGARPAHDLVERLSHQARLQGRPLREALAEDPQVGEILDAEALARVFDPMAAIGLAGLLVDRLLARLSDSP